MKTAASPKDVLSEGAEPILMQLIKGIQVDLKVNIWKKLFDVLMRVVGNCEVDVNLIPILGGIAPLLLLQINGNLDITIDDTMKEKIAENPLVEPVLLGASDLITTLSGNSFENDDELYEYVKKCMPAPRALLLTTLAKAVGDNITFEVLDEHLGVKGSISGEGLALIVRKGLHFAKERE